MTQKIPCMVYNREALQVQLFHAIKKLQQQGYVKQDCRNKSRLQRGISIYLIEYSKYVKVEMKFGQKH